MSREVAGEQAAIDAVLQAPPPRFTPDEACKIAAEAFGIVATSARNLGSERDQTFLLLDAEGVRLAVLKVSNPAEDAATLDMEALAAWHAAAADPGLVIARPRAVPGGRAGSGDPGAHRARWDNGPQTHWVRAYDVLDGQSRFDPRTLSDSALVAWGETTARLGLALRGFIHPNAIRRLPWDVQHAMRVRPMLDAIADRSQRTAV